MGQTRRVDAGVRDGVTTSEAQRVKDLEREVRERRKANEILKLASAFRPGGARPPTEVVKAFIDKHRDAFGVEPLCCASPTGAVPEPDATRHATPTGGRKTSAFATPNGWQKPVSSLRWAARATVMTTPGRDHQRPVQGRADSSPGPLEASAEPGAIQPDVLDGGGLCKRRVGSTWGFGSAARMLTRNQLAGCSNLVRKRPHRPACDF